MDTRKLTDAIIFAVENNASQSLSFRSSEGEKIPSGEYQASQGDLSFFEYERRVEDIFESENLSGKSIRGPYGSYSIQPMLAARVLLKCALEEEDIPNVVDRFANLIETGRSRYISVFVLAGVSCNEKLCLAEGVSLLRPGLLPPSTMRDRATRWNGTQRGMSFSALTKEYEVHNVIVDRQEAREINHAAKKSAEDAEEILEQTRLCLTLTNVAPTLSMQWAQPVDPVHQIGSGNGWDSAHALLGPSAEIDPDEAKTINAQYFSLPEAMRTGALKVALERLNAGSQRVPLVQKALDFGIGLEVLLLHGSSENTELSYRFRLHGAYLLGKNEADRKEKFESFKRCYGLRSKAAHTGSLPVGTLKNHQQIDDMQSLCKQVIREIIARGAYPNFEQLVLTGETPRPSNTKTSFVDRN